MSEATIRAAIYSAVNGVTNVGKVYDYERYANSWDDFQTLFTTTIGGVKQVRGWMIGYRGFPTAERETFRPGSKSGISRTHRFQIMGVMGIDDSTSSEKTFAALAEDVADALDDNDTLNAYLSAGPAQLGFDPSPFAGVLVHAAVILLDVVEAI